MTWPFSGSDSDSDIDYDDNQDVIEYEEPTLAQDVIDTIEEFGDEPEYQEAAQSIWDLLRGKSDED